MSREVSVIRVALAGVGNCAKSLVEGIEHYRSKPVDNIGLRRLTIGGFRPSNIEVVAAFDIDQRKVGMPLHCALASPPNRTMKIGELKSSDVIVQRGPTIDGLTAESRGSYIIESRTAPVDVSDILSSSGAEILVNYLPTGSNYAARFYADAALSAGCSFINCMPAPIMRDSALRQSFIDRGLVLMGDDIKSQLGATVLNRAILELLGRRGATISKSTQTNYGGNADHFNLQFRGRDKELSKTASLKSALVGSQIAPEVRMVYQQTLYDHKQSIIEIEAQVFGNAPLRIQVTLHDEDSPNSAGIVVDAIRGAKVLRDNRSVALADQLCAALMKDSIVQTGEESADELFDVAIETAQRFYCTGRKI